MPYIPPSSSLVHTQSGSAPSGPTQYSLHGRSHSSEAILSSSAHVSRDRNLPLSNTYYHRHRRSPTLCAHVSKLAENHLHHSRVPSKSKPSTADGFLNREGWESTEMGNGEPLIPTGAVLSPPDSRQNSSDEEEKEQRMLAELASVIKSIDLPSSSPSSPPQPSSTHWQIQSEDKQRIVTRVVDRSYFNLNPPDKFAEVEVQTPKHSDDDDDPYKPMPRKKSGELVRPALRAAPKKRPSSMPGTPTFSKAVHFGSQLEEVRHFLQIDRPLAVSAGSSPVEEYDGDDEFPFGMKDSKTSLEWEAKITNFPSDSDGARRKMPIRLEQVFLSSENKQLVGIVAVANLSYRKHVTARFTLDYWKTVSEVAAEFSDDAGEGSKRGLDDNDDRFVFNILLEDQPNLEKKAMFICVRYNVDGFEFWDNNNSMNYCVQFSKKAMAPREQRGVTPRTKLSKVTSPRPISLPPCLDDLDIDVTSQFGARVEATNLESTTKKFARESLLPDSPARRSKLGSNVFGDRYDFSTSLSTATDFHREDARQGKEKKNGEIGDRSKEPTRAPCVGSRRPVDFLLHKPNHRSPVYQELVDKYCFFGSTKPNTQDSSQVQAEASKLDRTVALEEDDESYSSSSSSASSSSSSELSPSPEPTKAQPVRAISRQLSPSPSQSPSQLSSEPESRGHSPSPILFSPFHESIMSPPTRTAIQG